MLSLSETPAHLKNIKSIIARTFHENEHYNSNKGKGVNTFVGAVTDISRDGYRQRSGRQC